MGFGQAIKHVFSNYWNFRGRASRSEFWWFYLFNLIVTIVLDLISRPLGLTYGGGETIIGDTIINTPGTSILGSLWGLAVLLPVLAVGTRRLHDSGKSAWFWLLLLTVLLCGIGLLIGVIVLIVLWILPSTPGPNKYGEGPATA